MLEAEQPQKGRMQVVDVDLVDSGFVAKLIGGPVVEATFDSPSGQPDGEAVGVMIAPTAADPLCVEEALVPA